MYGFPTRHLGPVQMTTDTAVGVTKLVVEDKIPLDKIPYVVCVSDTFLLWNFLICPLLQDYPTIKFNARESVEMPFRTYESTPGYFLHVKAHFVLPFRLHR